MFSQVELALDVESIVPQFIRRRFVVKCRTIRPNSTRHHCKVFRRFMAESELSSEAIVKALNPELVSESPWRLPLTHSHIYLDITLLFYYLLLSALSSSKHSVYIMLLRF